MRFQILKPFYVWKLDPNIARIQTTCDVFHNKRDDKVFLIKNINRIALWYLHTDIAAIRSDFFQNKYHWSKIDWTLGVEF